MERDIVKINLDFDAISAWRNTKNDDIPACSFLSVYEASGLEPYFKEYCESKGEGFQLVAINNILCNFYTLQRLKRFIEEIWQVYSLTIDGDGQVHWDTSKWAKGRKHYAKKMKAIVRNSVFTDFANFCPGIDDDLEDNVLVFRVYEDDPDVVVSEVEQA